MLTKSKADEIIKRWAPASEPAQDAASGAVAPQRLSGRALELWNQIKVPDNSKHDAKFYLACLRIGFTDDQAREATRHLPAGKANRDKRDDEPYWQSTRKWAHQHWNLDQAALLYVRKARAKDALLERFVDAMARVHDDWPDQYERAVKRMKKKGVRVVKLEKLVATARARDSIPDWDGFARHAVADGASAGWWYKGKAGWICYSSADWARNLTGRGVPPAAAAKALSDDPWTLVAEPFQPEELPDRKWNRNAAQLKHEPVEGAHPTWDQLFRVVGRGLDDVAKAAGFKSGAHYLFLWVASVIQRPAVKLPYLFFHGEAQDSGKSTFHEALKGLFTRGYVLANEALENTRGFNGELHGAVVCAADEIEVTRKAYKRIKQWTTGETILIHPKGKTAYDLKNHCHFIQTGNNLSDCPLLGGDTRITACHVWPVDDADKMNKDDMLRLMEEEGPALTHSLLHAELPPVHGRLGLPVLATADKGAQQTANLSKLEEWLRIQGSAVYEWSDQELANRFLETKPGPDYDCSRVLREIPRGCQVRRRLVAAVRDLASLHIWEGTVSELAESIGTKIAGDWGSPESLGMFLTQSPLPGLSVSRRRIKGKRLLRLGAC